MTRSLWAGVLGGLLAMAFPAGCASAQGTIDFATWLGYLEGNSWQADCADIMDDAVRGFESSSEEQWAWVDHFEHEDPAGPDAIGATYFKGGVPYRVELLNSGHGVLNVSTGQWAIDNSSPRVLRSVIEEAYHWYNGLGNYGASGSHEQLREDIKRCVLGEV